MRGIVAVMIICSGLIVIGCWGSRYSVNVTSLNDPTMSPSETYVLWPSIEGLSPNDLEFREYAQYIDRALASKGLRRIDDPSLADLAIFMNYGTGDPASVPYTYSVPVLGVTGGGTSTISLNTYDYGSGTSSQTTGLITEGTQIGVVGSKIVNKAKTVYRQFLVLEAINLETYRSSQEVMPAWRTSVVSSDSNGDLRRAFPVMVAASALHMGTNTEKVIKVSLYENEDRVKAIKGE